MINENCKMILFNLWNGFLNAPILTQVAATLGALISSLWIDLNVLFFAIMILVGLDTHLAIKATIKKGGKFKSSKIKQGLLQKLKLYPSIALITITLDFVFKRIYDYETNYLTYFMFAYICLYEAGSIIEKLAVLHPQSKAVAKLTKLLNLTEEKLNDKIK